MSRELAQCLPERNIGVLVLGLGNVLLGDDGLGAAAVARLEGEYRVPPGVHLADGGTLGLSLLGLLADSEHVILSKRHREHCFGLTEKTSVMRCAIVFRPIRSELPISWTPRV